MATKRDYGMGTYLLMRMPFGLFEGGRVLCSDGVVRTLKRIAQTADTFFSIPAAVEVKGKTVAGFVTVETEEGLSTETEKDKAVAKFCAVKYRKNWELLPEGTWRRQ